MKSNDDNKAIIPTLMGDEIKAYCDFLGGEVLRHHKAIENDEWSVEYNRRASKKYLDVKVYCDAIIELRKSAIKRHKKDIKETNENIKRARALQMH